MVEDTVEKIREQQRKLKNTGPAYQVGQQLIDIVRRDGAVTAQIVEEDLTAGKTLTECEKDIAAFAKQNKSGNFGFCSTEDAEKIIRKYFGIEEVKKEETTGMIDFEDFL